MPSVFTPNAYLDPLRLVHNLFAPLWAAENALAIRASGLSLEEFLALQKAS